MLLFFGYLSGIISAIACIPYIRDILHHKTKPERASWLIWAVLGGIAFFTQLEKGASNSLWMVGIQTLGVFIILMLSIKYGVGGFTKRDYLALIAAGIGLILWYFTSEALVALFIVIIIDAIGSALTMYKTYYAPESETMITWAMAGIAGICASLSVGSWDLILLSYPFYIIFANLGVVLAIYLGFKR